MNVFARDITVSPGLELHFHVTERWPDHFHEGVSRQLLVGAVALLRSVAIKRRLICVTEYQPPVVPESELDFRPPPRSHRGKRPPTSMEKPTHHL